MRTCKNLSKFISLLLTFVMLFGLVPAVGYAESYPFTSSTGSISGYAPDGYSYDAWISGSSVTSTAALYTVTIPWGTQHVDLDFNEDRIAYLYDANGNWKGSCGDYGDGTTGTTRAAVSADSSFLLSNYVQVQTPYDAAWNSDVLYAVNFDYNYTFTAKAGENSLSIQSFEKDGYSYTDWLGQTYTMGLFTLAVPEGTTEVELTISDNALAYNYGPENMPATDSDYISGAVSDYMTGSKQFTVKVDDNGDGKPDYIQIQSPYDDFWNTDFLYAITFTDAAAASSRPQTVNFADIVKGIADYYELNGSSRADAILAMQAYNGSGSVVKNGSLSGTSVKDVISAASIGESLSVDFSAVDISGEWGIFSAPYLELAYEVSGASRLSGHEEATLKAKLIDYVYNGYNGEKDPSFLASVINVLAGDSSSDAKAAIDEAVRLLSLAQQKDGGFTWEGGESNANSTASVIIGLCAAGVDVNNDSRFIKNGKSAIKALLAFCDNDTIGFNNELDRVTAFTALVSYARLNESGAAYNIYKDAKYTSDTAELPDIDTSTNYAPGPSGDKSYTVSASIVGLDGTWASGRYTVPGGTSAFEVFDKLVKDNGLSYSLDRKKSYISSISDASGNPLAEFDKGPNSGWLYTVDGKAPTVSIEDYSISSNCRLKVYYTEDYTKDEAALESVGKTKEELLPEEIAGAIAGSFSDVKPEDWFAEAAAWASENKIMIGTGDGKFSPSDKLSRAMMAQILYNLAGSPETGKADDFSDVAPSAWYANSASWLKTAGISSGVGEGKFGPENVITREQFALMLLNYAKIMGYDVTKTNELTDFKDADSVNPWAIDALKWANALGIINGRPGGLLDPQASLTRAEAASVLMNFEKIYQK